MHLLGTDHKVAFTKSEYDVKEIFNLMRGNLIYVEK